jgi:hypothetical protein
MFAPLPRVRLVSAICHILLFGFLQLPSNADTKKQSTKKTAVNLGVHQTAKPINRVFIDFPQDHGLGQISILPKVWNVEAVPVPSKFLSQAKGSVQLPAEAKFAFAPNGLISEHPTYLAKFPAGALQSLQLSGLDINNTLLSAVGALSGLKHIDFNETDLTDLDLVHLKSLKNLAFLSLNKTLIKGPGLADLRELNNLLFLNLNGNSIEPGSVKSLTAFPLLNHLELSHCAITDRDLLDVGKIKSLVELNLSFNNGITDKGIKCLAGLKNLSYLDLDQSHTTARGVLALKGLPINNLTLATCCNNQRDQALIQKAFPHATIIFTNRNTRDAVEFFDPGHALPQ